MGEKSPKINRKEASLPYEEEHLVDHKPDELAPVIVMENNREKLTLSPEDDLRPTEEPAPDGGFGWIVVFSVFVIHIIIDGMTYSFGVLLPDLLTKFQGTTSETSWIMSVLIGTTYGCAPLPSFLASRFGRRPTALVGGVLACLGAFLSSYATAVWQLIVLFGFLTGLGCGFMYLPAVVTVNHWFEKLRARAVGMAVCGSGLGMILFSPFTVYLLDEYGVSGCLIIYAGILLNCCVFAALLRPTPGEERNASRSRLQENITLNHHELKELLPNDRVLVPEAGRGWGARAKIWIVRRVDMDLMVQWRFWVYCLVAFFGGISSYIPHAFLPHRAELEADASKDYAAYLMSAMGLANIFGRLTSSALSDQPWLNRIIVYSCCCLIAGLSTALSYYCHSYNSFMAYSVIYGFTGGYIIALQSVVLTDIVGLEKLSSAFGLLLFIEGVAVFGGPPFAGKLKDLTGDYRVPFIVFGCLMAMAGISLLTIPLTNFVVKRQARTVKLTNGMGDSVCA